MCRNYYPAGTGNFLVPVSGRNKNKSGRIFKAIFVSVKTVFVSENSISGFIFPSGYDEETEVSSYFLDVIDSAFHSHTFTGIYTFLRKTTKRL